MVLLSHTLPPSTKSIRSACAEHLFTHLNIVGVQYTVVPFCILLYAYILIGMEPLKSLIRFELLLEQYFHSFQFVLFLLQMKTWAKQNKQHVTTKRQLKNQSCGTCF